MALTTLTKIGKGITSLFKTPTESVGKSIYERFVEIYNGTLSFKAKEATHTRELRDRFSDVINVKDYGAKGDGISDDSDAIIAAITSSKNNFGFYLDSINGYRRSGGSIFFPSGIYKITKPIVLDGVGIQLKGESRENTIICQSSNSGDLFRLGDPNAYLWCGFENISFAAGIPKIAPQGSNNEVYIDLFQKGSRGVNCFNYLSNTSSARFNTWSSVTVMGGFASIFNVGGVHTHSENTFYGCSFFHCDAFLNLDNGQSIVWRFDACDIEFMHNYVFNIKQGGTFEMTGGSIINGGDFLRLETAGEGVGVGESNGNFAFRGVKFEMFNNIDHTRKPKLINCVNPAYGVVTFDDCNSMGGGALEEDVIMELKGAISVEVNNSLMIGVVNTVPSTQGSINDYAYNMMSKIMFNNCRRVPSVNRSENSGRFYTVIYKGCNGVADAVLAKGEYNYLDKACSITATTLDVLDGTNVARQDIVFKSVSIIKRVLVIVDQGGGYAGKLQAYRDQNRTQLILESNISSQAVRQYIELNIPLGEYSGIYFSRESEGNVGHVNTSFTVDYYSVD